MSRMQDVASKVLSELDAKGISSIPAGEIHTTIMGYVANRLGAGTYSSFYSESSQRRIIIMKWKAEELLTNG